MINSSLLPLGDVNNSNADIPSEIDNITVMALEMYCIPLISLFGLCGNTLSAITFVNKSLRKASCSFYLAVRSVSDNGFLLALMLTWISGVFELELSRVRGVCQAILLLTYISGCVSVWIVVFVTIENYIRICHPLVVNSISSRKPARILISTLCICAFGVYHIPLWIANPDCTHNQKYCDVTQALVYTDTLLTLVIPSLLIIGLMASILCKLLRNQSFERPRLLRRSPQLMNKPNRKAVPAVKITKMLFIVSVMFFFLNFPSHAIRLYILINSFLKGQRHISNALRTIQTIFQLIYYLSFSANILIYISFGKNFRKTFKELLCRQSLRCSENSLNEAINTVPNVQLRRRFSLTVNLGTNGNTYLSVPDYMRPASVSCFMDVNPQPTMTVL